TLRRFTSTDRSVSPPLYPAPGSAATPRQGLAVRAGEWIPLLFRSARSLREPATLVARRLRWGCRRAPEAKAARVALLRWLRESRGNARALRRARLLTASLLP